MTTATATLWENFLPAEVVAKQLKDGEENKRQIFEQVAREQTGKRRKLERTRPNERVEFGVSKSHEAKQCENNGISMTLKIFSN